ncbi:MAG: hypothetical protein LBQ00_04790 [Syntrophobacterales bacterium]|jgi:DNA-binding IclR family transcriptional regulator|nr:hypothetical protein [Syntrophobacterales bacterium]
MHSTEVAKKTVIALRFRVDHPKSTEIGKIYGNPSVNKDTAFGVLRARKAKGFTKQDQVTKHYRVTTGLIQFSKETLLATNFARLVRPLMDTLPKLVSETVCLEVIEGGRVKVVQTVETRKGFKTSTPPDTFFFIKTPILFKVYLSTITNADIINRLKDRSLNYYTDRSIPNIKELLHEDEKTKRSGYTLNLGELKRKIRAGQQNLLLSNMVSLRPCAMDNGIFFEFL